MGEALRNVRSHAGTGDARVLAQVGPGRLEVSVIDRGRGFRTAELAADSRRLGLRHSVSARMAAVGGSADIWSEPGQGTRITLRWELPQPVAAETACADRLEEQFAAAARRAFALAVVVGWLAALIPVIVHRDQARSMPAGVAIWLTTAVVIGLTARVVARRPLVRRESAAVLLVAVASAVAGAVNTVEPPGELVVSWGTTMINPLLVALAVLSRPPRERYAAAGFATVAMVGIVIGLGLGCRYDPLVLARLAAAV
ncbi:ATP-binding protein, partial [Frankia sp. CpI1-P]